MDRRQSVVASVAEKAHPDVKIRDPALEFVMPSAMHPVRRADGGHGSRKFDDGEGGSIIHDVVVEEAFVAAARAEISRRSAVQSAGGGDAGEEPAVLRVPEAV